MTVAGTTTVNGVISAGGVGAPYGAAGGSVFLTTGTLTGNGTIRANGGSGANNDGGGGRIAVILTNSADFGSVKFQAYGGSSSQYKEYAAAGTIYLRTASQPAGHGTLIIDASNIVGTTATTLIGSNVTDTTVGTVVITNKAVLELTNQWLAVNGSFSNNNSAVVGRSGSAVILASTADATVTGTNQFWDLTITTATKQVFFAAGSSNQVNGTLTLKGVTLKSTSAGSQWFLRLAPGGSQDVGIVTVQDSDALSGQTIYAQKGSQDLGNNENWIFPPIPRGTVTIFR